LLTAVLFIRHVSAIIVTVTDPTCWDTTTCVVTVEPVLAAPYTVTTEDFLKIIPTGSQGLHDQIGRIQDIVTQ